MNDMIKETLRYFPVQRFHWRSPTSPLTRYIFVPSEPTELVSQVAFKLLLRWLRPGTAAFFSKGRVLFCPPILLAERR